MALIRKWSADHLRESPHQLWTLPGLISTAILLILPRWLPLWQSDWTEPVAGYTIAHIHGIKCSQQPEERMSPICFALLGFKPGNVINVSSTVVLMWPLLKQEKNPEVWDSLSRRAGNKRSNRKQAAISEQKSANASIFSGRASGVTTEDLPESYPGVKRGCALR